MLLSFDLDARLMSMSLPFVYGRLQVFLSADHRSCLSSFGGRFACGLLFFQSVYPFHSSEGHCTAVDYNSAPIAFATVRFFNYGNYQSETGNFETQADASGQYEITDQD